MSTDLLKTHPLADQFPMMEGDEFDRLVQDVRDNGLQHPIVLLGDLILDGRNRYRACVAAGVEPTFVEYTGDTDTLSLLQYVQSENVYRRHLTPSQKAIIAADLLPVYEEAARERQRLAALRTNQMRTSAVDAGADGVEPVSGVAVLVEDAPPEDGEFDDLIDISLEPPEEGAAADNLDEGPSPEPEVDSLIQELETTDLVDPDLALLNELPPGEAGAPAQGAVVAEEPDIADNPALAAGRARDMAGDALGVSGRLVQDAKKVLDADRHLAQEVRSGHLTLPSALRQIRAAEAPDKPEAPSLLPKIHPGYQVIFANPPWGKLPEPMPRIHAPEHAIMAVSAPPRHLVGALDMLRILGFDCVGQMVCVSDKSSNDPQLRVQHHTVLFGARGSLRRLPEELRFETVVEGDGARGMKAVRSWLEQVTPGAQRLDMFATRSTDTWAGGLDPDAPVPDVAEEGAQDLSAATTPVDIPISADGLSAQPEAPPVVSSALVHARMLTLDGREIESIATSHDNTSLKWWQRLLAWLGLATYVEPEAAT